MRWKIFVAALVIRWAYVIAIFGSMGDTGLETTDSATYLFYAHEFAPRIVSHSLSGLQWLGPAGQVMPLAHWLFSLCVLAFGVSAALAYVLLQGLIDAGTCVLVYGLARTLNESYAA